MNQTEFVARHGKNWFDQASHSGSPWDCSKALSSWLAQEYITFAEQDYTKLHEPISKVIDVPETWKKMTLHQLLTHSSGLINKTPLIEGVNGAIYRNPSEIVENLQQQELLPNFQAGTGFAYSNSAYSLIVHLLEHLGKDTYDNLLKRHILKPLGLKSTSVDDESLILPNRATGYIKNEKGLFRSCCYHLRNFIGAGNIVSTAHDLSRWVKGLIHGDLLSEEYIVKLLHPHIAIPKHTDTAYGYGWVVQKWNGHRLIGHDGQVDGFNSLLSYFPDHELTIVILANRHEYPVKHVPHQMRNFIAEKLLGTRTNL